MTLSNSQNHNEHDAEHPDTSRRPVPGSRDFDDNIAKMMEMLKEEYHATKHTKIGQDGEILYGQEIHDVKMPDGNHYRDEPEFVNLDQTGTSYFPIKGVIIARCSQCGLQGTDKSLARCSICGKFVCADHSEKNADGEFVCRNHGMPEKVGSIIAFLAILLFVLYLFSLVS